MLIEQEIVILFVILIATIIMLVTEVFRIDIVAILCMLALGWSGVLEPLEALSGFSSNAVIAMMSVMIMGYGIRKTGLLDHFSQIVLKKVGNDKTRIIGFMSLSAGLLSGLIQNIGAAALFLPSILDISRKSKIPASALIMPIGFAAIIGGTLTMVGSGALILINDLLLNMDMEPFGLFSVTPVGIVLLTAAVLFFILFGRFVLPQGVQTDGKHLSQQKQLIDALHLPHTIRYYRISLNSPLIDITPEQSGMWQRFNVNILGISKGKQIEYAPWRETKFKEGQILAVLGEESNIEAFASEFNLTHLHDHHKFTPLTDPDKSGFAEILIPHNSELIGQSIRKYQLRKRHAVEPVMIFSKGEEIRGDFSNHELIAGDSIIIYGLWEKIIDFRDNLNFVVATPFTVEKKDQSKAWIAGLCFLFAIVLALTGFPISIAFLTGAIAMVITRVMNIQDAYEAIEWKIVFLLAGLIPLGIAMQKTQAATLMAEQVMTLIHDAPVIVLLLTIAVISTVLSLLMSYIGAIVVLAPLVTGMAEIAGVDPRPMVLMAAICVSNSFILPTHQVNALLMSSGGYRNADYLKAGSGMTIIYIIIVVSMFYLFYI